MINLFDLSTGMPGTKLSTDKSYRNGDRNLAVVARKAVDPVEAHSENKPVSFESRKGSSGRKLGNTPIKMLISQEMSREIDSKRKSPSVVARLMGLDDALPDDTSVLPTKRNLQEGGLVHSHSDGGALQDFQQRQAGYVDRWKPHELQSYCQENKEYSDVREVWRRPSRSNFFDNQALQSCKDTVYRNEKRMALVREKFIEAKRLATDEKLLESKEFQDALEVLSSNRDLFLKFLEEPNSIFSKHLKELHSVPPSPQMKRITVLKPSKTMEEKSECKVNQHQQGSGLEMHTSHWSSSFACHAMTEKLPQPTRIVVLKPGPRKHHDLKAPATPVSSPELEPPASGHYYGCLDMGDTIVAKEVAKETTRQMCESLSRHRRDESLLSSVFSNGYVGDDSSFNRSENYLEEEDDNISDLEIANSWDYTSNRYGSPCVHSSLSRASYSPESSVIREAKMRLSERWALVSSNGLYQEKLQERRSSSTLGEMLSIRELKRESRSDMRSGVSGSMSCGTEEDFRVPAACFSIGRTRDEIGDEGSVGDLSRSKSVPTASSIYSNISLNTSDSQINKSVSSKGPAKSRSGKTSFKGRVSSLFFSKNKKGGKDKSDSSPLKISQDDIPVNSANALDKKHDDSSQVVQTHDPEPEASTAGKFEGNLCRLSSSATTMKDKSDASQISSQDTLSRENPKPSDENQDILQIPKKPNENQDHPSPTSILDAPFKDDRNDNASNLSKSSNSDNPQALSRSSPIESISRTLSWDDSCSEASSLYSFKLSRAFLKTGKDDPEVLVFIQNLLAAAGLYNNRLSSIFNGWHSPETPLDPKLLDMLLDRKEEVAKSRERRSNQKLLFDCVNHAMLEIGNAAETGAYRRADTPLAAEVWALASTRLSGDGKLSTGEAENDSQVVNFLLGREVAGCGWTGSMQSEIAAISNEIGVQVLIDLVGEALTEMIVN